MQVAEELVNGRHRRWDDSIAVLRFIEIRSEPADKKRWARSRRPFSLYETEDGTNRASPYAEPILRLLYQIRAMPFRQPECDPEIIFHIGRLHFVSIEVALFKVLDEQTGVPSKNVQLLYAPFYEIGFEVPEQRLTG